MAFLEVIKTVALLCTVDGGGYDGGIRYPHEFIAEYQLKCQKYYLECVTKTNKTKELEDRLLFCILERKL